MAKTMTKTMVKTMNRPQSGQLNITGGAFADHKVDGRKLLYKDLSEILQDGYINSLWNKRRGGVVAVDWIVEPASESAIDKSASEFVESTLKALNFDRVCYKMMSAIWYGYSFAQIVWEKQADRFIISDIKVHDSTNFKYDPIKKTWAMGEIKRSFLIIGFGCLLLWGKMMTHHMVGDLGLIFTLHGTCENTAGSFGQNILKNLVHHYYLESYLRIQVVIPRIISKK